MGDSFLRWAGGKTHLVKKLIPLIPAKFNTYYEPMLGSGAMFFALKKAGLVRNAVLGDYNKELICLYTYIALEPEQLISEIKSALPSNGVPTQEWYYEIRDDYNTRRELDLRKAAQFYLLNRTGFNGLYRVNKKGKYNVPFGRYTSREVLMESRIQECSELLQDCEILSADWQRTIRHAERHDFIYLDPPYIEVKDNSFTKYTSSGFDMADHEHMAEHLSTHHTNGVYFMLSNSSTPDSKKLYNGYVQHTLEVKRRISRDTKTRNTVEELVVLNYETVTR